ncbi:MAG: general secretion pathway protein GspB [Planctomycetota bacterium]|nr:general secretion pathway protein GspB [Planctomycetota bacterium]
MNEKPTPSVAAGKPPRWAGLLLALASRPRGRWATARGRWCQTLLTAGLVVAGVGAWALAIVQPWPGHLTERGAVSAAGGVDTGKIRAASDEVEKRLPPPVPTARTPARNPFALRAMRAAADPETRPTEGRPPDRATGPARDAKTILETLKGLKLEVTLTAPTGERWAVINGETLREGDSIAGLELTDIQEGKVKLRQGGTSCLLRMD